MPNRRRSNYRRALAAAAAGIILALGAALPASASNYVAVGQSNSRSNVSYANGV